MPSRTPESPWTIASMSSIPSVSMRSAGMPSDSVQSRIRGSTSVASSGASTWMYSQPSATSSSISERLTAAASANIANASA